MTRRIRNPAAAAAQGRPAGFVTRLLADALDLLVVYLVFLGLIALVQITLALLTDRKDTSVDPRPVINVGLFLALYGLYCVYSWSTTGRTLGKQLFGLRVVTVDGQPLRPRRAFARALCCGLLWWGLPWSLVSKRSAALHDLVVHTAVIYDWRAHEPEELRPPAPARREASTRAR